MSKQKIKKAFGGLQLSYNGSPLASLNSNSTLTLQSGQNPQSSQLPTSIQDRWNQLDSDFNNKLFGIGLGLSRSGDKDTKQYGQQLVNGYMDQLHQPLFPNNTEQDPNDTKQDPNDIYADVNRLTNSNFDLQSGLDTASQVLGQIPGKVSQVGQKVINTAQKVKSAYSNISEIAALQKKGVKGLKTAKAGNIAAIGGAVSDLVSDFLPEKTEYQGDKGAITQTMDSVYDGISDAAMSFGPAGMVVGGIMKGGKLLGGVLNSIGGGTDGMCVCAGTKIFKASGEIINIEDLKKEDGIIGWDKNSKQIVPQLIHDFIEPRQKECLEIVLKNGYSIKCSIDHPILSDNSPKARNRVINGKRIAIRPWEFRRADELKVGDFVGLANNIDYWGDTNVPNAYIVGLLIGDGSYGKGASCRLISADPDTWRFLENNNLGVLNHCEDSRPEKYNKEIRTYRIIGGMELLHQLGIAYQTGKDKTLPKNIGKFDKVSVCNLLAGLFDTDGSISVNEEKQNYSITLYQSNINLLEEVRIQLHKLGIFSTIGTRKAAKYELGGKIINSNESYRLEIHDISSAIKFYNLIPLNISYKKENLERIYNMLKDKKVQEHNDISGAKQCKIVSITPIGIQTVYNLQADYNHTYLANCIITHNTTTDAILGSSFLNLTPIGLLNGFGGERAQTLTKNDLAFENVGSSYTGTSWSVNDALRKSGKKYGFFSKGALEEANKQIIEARRQQNIMESISDYATDRFDIRNSMAAINGNRRRFNMQGGYNQAAIQVGKNGMSIVKRVVGKYKMQEKLKLHNQQQAYLNPIPDNQTFVTEEIQEANIIPENFKDISELYPYNTNLEKVEEFKEGGTLSNNSFIEEINLSSPYNELKEESIVSTIIEIEPTESVEEFKEGGKLSTIIEEIELNNLVEEFKEGGSIKEENTEYEPENVSDIIKFVNNHKKVNFVQRLKDSFRETIPDWEGNKVATHKLRVELDRGKVKLFPMVQEINDKLYDFTDPKNNHENPVWDALDMAEKNGDVIIFNNLNDAVWFSKNYKQYYPTFEDYAGEPHLKYDEKQNKYIFTYPKDHKATISELEWYNSNDPEAIEFRKHYKYNEETNEYLPILIEFKEGGSFNVIPEGALHARLHHMENDQNITKKGIPVVSTDENGEIEQHAEIEKEEIILRLSLTKRLEELAKENTDEAAIEAGKILVEEILNNTIDNTNTLL